MERIKDYLLMEEEFIQNQERLKPREEKNEVCVLSGDVAMVTDDNRRKDQRLMILGAVQWQLVH